jgi:hypothetical protein
VREPTYSNCPDQDSNSLALIFVGIPSPLLLLGIFIVKGKDLLLT